MAARLLWTMTQYFTVRRSESGVQRCLGKQLFDILCVVRSRPEENTVDAKPSRQSSVAKNPKSNI